MCEEENTYICKPTIFEGNVKLKVYENAGIELIVPEKIHKEIYNYYANSNHQWDDEKYSITIAADIEHPYWFDLLTAGALDRFS